MELLGMVNYFWKKKLHCRYLTGYQRRCCGVFNISPARIQESNQHNNQVFLLKTLTMFLHAWLYCAYLVFLMMLMMMDCFCGMVDRRKAYFQPGPLSEILTIANLRHAASRFWTCAEPEFRLSRINSCKFHQSQ